MSNNTTTPWKSTVRPPVNGERVTGAVSGRGDRDNAQRGDHLKQRLDAIEAGKALLLYEELVDSTVLPFQPVYLDASTNTWYPAQLAFEDGSDGVLAILAARSRPLGILLSKQTSTAGVIVTHGEIRTSDEAALTQVFGSSREPGLYYLSPTGVGHLVRQRPPIPVRVLTLAGPYNGGEYRLFVNLTPKEEIDEHLHYHVVLATLPAGIPNCVPAYTGPSLEDFAEGGAHPGVVQTVETPDPDARGWLPADDPVFDGMEIPAGAKFGYNVAADAVLSKIWPPVPAGFACVVMSGSTEQSQRVVQVNAYGIWWMENGWAKAPWSPNYRPCFSEEGSSSLPANSSSSSGTPSEDPFDLQLDFWMTKASMGGLPLVNSLKPADQSVVITDENGEAASTGRLEVKVRQPTAESDLSATVVKSIDFPTSVIKTGLVTGSLRALSPNISLVGTTSGDGKYRGDVGIRFTDLTFVMDLPLEITALNNVEEENLDGVLLLNFPEDRASAIRGKVGVHNFQLDEGAELKVTLRFWLLARATMNLIGQPLTLSYMRMPKPDGCIPLTLPSSVAGGDEEPVMLNLCDLSLNAGQYVEVASEEITVEPGDTLFFTLERAAVAGSIGLLRVRPTITAV